MTQLRGSSQSWRNLIEENERLIDALRNVRQVLTCRATREMPAALLPLAMSEAVALIEDALRPSDVTAQTKGKER